MSLQFIIKISYNFEDLEKNFFTLSECVEIFPIEKEHFGISIPTKVVDEYGEDIILNFMMTYDHYDLWSGLWFNEK